MGAATKPRSIFNSKANDAIKIGLCRSAVESILLYGIECLPLTSTLKDKLDSACRRILRYALGVHFPDCISNAELTRRTGATSLFKTLRQRRLTLVGHALRMANPSPLMILLRFFQSGLRRRRGQARSLTLHQNIIDDISAINQSVKSMTSASKSYLNRIVATLNTTAYWSVGWNVGFGYRGRRFEHRQQYVASLSKTLYSHCFSRLSCEISTRWGQPREGCSVL